jgi:hypothetical protein
MNTKQCRDEEAASGYQIVQSRLSFWLHRPMHWRSPLVFAWGIVGIYLIADLILLPVSRLTLASSTAWYLLYPALVVGVVACVLQAIRYRLRSDSTKIARLLVAVADGFGLVAYGCLFMWAFAIVSITFSYLSTSFSLPLRDADLAMIDRAVGFDWPGFLAWTNRQPLIAEALKTSYHTSGLQLLLVFLFLSFSRRREWLSEFIAIFAISSLLTGLGMALMPAEGAYAYYHPTADQFSGYSLDAGMWHHKILIA